MESVRLHDGTQVLIRRIRADDGARLQAAYERLSPATKYRRFLAPKPHLSASDVRYLVEVDGASHVALVAVLADRPEHIIGVGRLVRLRDEPDAAEVAIVVGDPYQGQGLGGELLERLRLAALEIGIERMQATVLAHNVAIHRLLDQVPARALRRRHVDELDEIEIDLAA